MREKKKRKETAPQDDSLGDTYGTNIYGCLSIYESGSQNKMGHHRKAEISYQFKHSVQHCQFRRLPISPQTTSGKMSRYTVISNGNLFSSMPPPPPPLSPYPCGGAGSV